MIDAYLNHQLTRKEIDILWVRFLQNPAWFEYFEIDLHLRSVINKSQLG